MFSERKTIESPEQPNLKKLKVQNLFGTMEQGNAGTVYAEKKDRVRRTGDSCIYNSNRNIME
jgi:hypothetical protein